MTQEARYHRMLPELRKANLVEATLVCLKRHGFQGASIRKISAEAGVSVGLISHHYAGKDELVAEAYMAVTGRVMGLLREAMAQINREPEFIARVERDGEPPGFLDVDGDHTAEFIDIGLAFGS